MPGYAQTQAAAAPAPAPIRQLTVYDVSQTPKKGDVFLLPLAGAIRLLALIATPATENSGHFSFAGDLIAYRSDESGIGEIYVRPFNVMADPSSVGGASKVTNSGGMLFGPRWRNDDKEIYYLSTDGDMTAVPVTTKPLSVGAPTKLFRLPLDFLQGTPGPTASTDISGDGQRFVVLLPAK